MSESETTNELSFCFCFFFYKKAVGVTEEI